MVNRAVDLKLRGYSIAAIAKEIGITHGAAMTYCSTRDVRRYAPDKLQKLEVFRRAGGADTVVKLLRSGVGLETAIKRAFSGRVTGRRLQAKRLWLTAQSLESGANPERVLDGLYEDDNCENPEAELQRAALMAYRHLSYYRKRADQTIEGFSAVVAARITGLGVVGVSKVTGTPLKCNDCGVEGFDLTEFKGGVYCRECLCRTDPKKEITIEYVSRFISTEQKNVVDDSL